MSRGEDESGPVARGRGGDHEEYRPRPFERRSEFAEGPRAPERAFRSDGGERPPFERRERDTAGPAERFRPRPEAPAPSRRHREDRGEFRGPEAGREDRAERPDGPRHEGAREGRDEHGPAERPATPPPSPHFAAATPRVGR